MKRTAFTLIEIVFAVVVISIVSSIVVSYAKPNDNAAYSDASGVFHQATGRYLTAAVQLMGHIRYTQHLAMIDNQFEIGNNNWYKGRWRLGLYRDGKDGYALSYTIFSDAGGYGRKPEATEIAKDPSSNGKLLSGWYDIANPAPFVNRDMNLTKRYGINDVLFTEGCSGTSLHFDQFGRPYKTSPSTTPFKKSKLIRTTCKIKFCSEEDCNNDIEGKSSKLVVILVEPETGYTHLSTDKNDLLAK